MFQSASFALKRKGLEVDFTEYDMADWLDAEGGVQNAKVKRFLDTFTNSMTKDITEEKVRLANHCKYFIETSNAGNSEGKKLGFIAQEIGREINTLGSKANDSNIQKSVTDMKDGLEKIKEQLLNVL